MSKKARPLHIVLAAVATPVFITPLSYAADGPEEIIVFSRKVEERIQDVPVSITAFSATQIDEARIENLNDVAALTPGLNFFNPIGESLPVPVIRGIAPTDIFGEPNAAVFIDGVYAAGREGLNFSLLDVERIEVNKGPQSSLYGRNAFSGAINYVTKRPADQLESYVEGTVGNRGRVETIVGVSGPLIDDKLGARLNMGYDTWDGAYDNPISDEDVGGYRFRTATGSVEFTPTDAFDAFFTFYVSEDDIDDTATTSLSANCENTGRDDAENRRLANYCGEVPDLETVNAELRSKIVNNPQIADALEFAPGKRDVAKIPGASGDERSVRRFSLNLDWDLDYGSVTALTGYSQVKFNSIIDGSRNRGFTIPFIYCDNVFGYANPDPSNPTDDLPGCSDWRTPKAFTAGTYVVSPTDSTKEISQELRFSSPQDRPLRYSVGGYWFDVEAVDQEAYLIGNAPFLPVGLETPTGPGTTPPTAAFGPWPGFGLSIGDPAYRPWFAPNATAGMEETVFADTSAWALFGTLDYDLTDRLTADLQMRYTREDKDFAVTAPAIPDARAVSRESKYLTGRVGLKFTVDDNLMVYGSVSNGAKPAGFDTDVVDVLNQGSRIVVVPFDKETLVSYELGAKGSTANGVFSYDAALYYVDWEDIVIPQVFNNDPITGDPLEQPEGFNTNAGDATVKGGEVQGNVQLTDAWAVGFGGSYTSAKLDNARLESFADFPSFAPDGDVSGNTLLRQPEWQANANLRYVRAINADWEFRGRADVTYQDEYFGGLDNQWTVPSHTYVNLRFALESERYTIALWGKNIFNNDAPIAAFRDVYFNNSDDVFLQDAPFAAPEDFFPWRLTVTHPRLRTYGLTVRVRFGNL